MRHARTRNKECENQKGMDYKISNSKEKSGSHYQNNIINNLSVEEGEALVFFVCTHVVFED
jgi:hypothetical protein